MDENRFYNSALKNNTKRFVDPKPVNWFEYKGCTAAAYDLRNGAYPPMLGCDVIYCEPPYPAGLATFDQRAGAVTGSYKNFGTAFASVWAEFEGKPRALVTNSQLSKYLPTPEHLIPVKLNGAKSNLACWGLTVVEGASTQDICHSLGLSFCRMGDFTCGYGRSVRDFRRARSGNTFVATDYDKNCIGVLKELLISEDSP